MTEFWPGFSFPVFTVVGGPVPPVPSPPVIRELVSKPCDQSGLLETMEQPSRDYF